MGYIQRAIGLPAAPTPACKEALPADATQEQKDQVAIGEKCFRVGAYAAHSWPKDKNLRDARVTEQLERGVPYDHAIH